MLLFVHLLSQFAIIFVLINQNSLVHSWFVFLFFFLRILAFMFMLAQCRHVIIG